MPVASQVPRQLLDDVNRAIDTFWTGQWQQHHRLPWPPEWNVFPYLQASRIAWAIHPIPAVLVRNGGKLDCWRLRRKEKQVCGSGERYSDRIG